MKTVIVKIGTNAITKGDKTLDFERLKDLVRQFSELCKKYNLVVVSSGAMGCGRTLINVDRYEEVTRRQLYAVVGQVKLMSIYADLFHDHNLDVAQMLATKSDFEHRVHYLNTKNCLESLFKEKIVPIVNENDFVAIEELMFTDNDELAGILAQMLTADKLIILTNVDGIYDKKANVIPEFLHTDDVPEHILTSEKSSFGKGGMQTKFKMAKEVASNGTEVVIANASESDVSIRVLDGEHIGTRFVANPSVTKSMWY